MTWSSIEFLLVVLERGVYQRPLTVSVSGLADQAFSDTPWGRAEGQRRRVGSDQQWQYRHHPARRRGDDPIRYRQDRQHLLHLSRTYLRHARVLDGRDHFRGAKSPRNADEIKAGCGATQRNLSENTRRAEGCYCDE